MLILYFVVAILILVATGVYMQHEEEHSRRSYDGDTVAAGVAIAVFWPFVLALILLFAVFAGPVVLGMFLYKEYNKRNTV